MKFNKKYFLLLAIALIALLVMPWAEAATKAPTDTGYLGADQWIVQTDGDIIPAQSSDIGSSADTVDNIYVDDLVVTDIALNGYKYHYYPIGYGTASTVMRIGGGAEPLLCTDLSGVEELGSTQGYVTTTAAADNLAFRFALPETFVDSGAAGDLVLQFYVDEQVTGDAVTYDVNIYEFGATTPILTDTLTVKNGEAAGWYDLDTYGTGIGADADIDADDILVITFSPEAGTPVLNSANIYGFRIKYATGIEATQ